MVNFSRKVRNARPAENFVPSQSNSKGLRLDPGQLLAAWENRVDFDLLEQLAGRSVISALEFDRRTLVELCKFAALLEVTEIAMHHPLDGKLVVTAFFEASIRTRLSFESAVLRLDGKIVSVPDGRVTGTAKGESLADIGEMLNTYGDLVVLRHPVTSSTDEIRQNLQIPLVNAGNGTGEHPTQAMVDWCTILKWRPELSRDDCPADRKIHIAIIGTPGTMRAVKSFMLMALHFPNAVRKITVISEMVDSLGEVLNANSDQSPIPVELTNNLQDVMADVDLIYMNSIAFVGNSYINMDKSYRLDKDSGLREDTVIMHPFARNEELDTSLDDTAHNLYFAQAASAVFVRQALLIALLDRVPSLPPSIRLLTT